MQRYVLGFAFSLNGARVALIRKLRPAWQADKFNGIGGKIELGETALQAMYREFREETGVRLENWIYKRKMVGQDFEVSVYAGTFLDHDIPRTVTDEEVLVWPVTAVHDLVTIDNVPALIALCQIEKDVPTFTLHY